MSNKIENVKKDKGGGKLPKSHGTNVSELASKVKAGKTGQKS